MDCQPSKFPMDTEHKLALYTAPLSLDDMPYRRLTGQLVYISITRPDLAFASHVPSQFLAKPTEDHLNAAYMVLSRDAQKLPEPKTRTGIFRVGHRVTNMEKFRFRVCSDPRKKTARSGLSRILIN